MGLLPNGLLIQETGLRKIFKTNFDVYLKGKRINLGILPNKLFWAKMTFGNSPEILGRLDYVPIIIAYGYFCAMS